MSKKSSPTRLDISWLRAGSKGGKVGKGIGAGEHRETVALGRKVLKAATLRVSAPTNRPVGVVTDPL